MEGGGGGETYRWGTDKWQFTVYPNGYVRALSICHQNWLAGQISYMCSKWNQLFPKDFCWKPLPLCILLTIDWSGWIVFIDKKWNSHYDKNGLASQFWQMESALSLFLSFPKVNCSIQHMITFKIETCSVHIQYIRGCKLHLYLCKSNREHLVINLQINVQLSPFLCFCVVQ